MFPAPLKEIKAGLKSLFVSGWYIIIVNSYELKKLDS